MKTIPAVLLAAALAVPTLRAAEVHNTITIAGYEGESVLTDFPLLVRVSEEIPGFYYAESLEGGADIHFRDVNGVEVPFEIERWNPAGESLVWVKVPVLSGTDTKIDFYHGAPTAFVRTDETAAAKVWTKYVAVFHFGTSDDDAGGSSLKVVNSKNGTSGARFPVGTSNGVLGEYYDFTLPSGSNRINLQTSTTVGQLFANRQQQTVTGWICPRKDRDLNDSSGVRLFTNKYNYDQTNGFDFYLAPNKIQLRGSSAAAPTVVYQPAGGTWGHDLDYGKWSHVGCIVNGATGSVIANGAIVQTGEIAAMSSTDRVLSFGNYFDKPDDKTCPYTGLFDEVRLYDGVAPADWVAAEYATVHDADFVTVGSASGGDSSIVATFKLVSTWDGRANFRVSVEDLGEALSADVYLAYGRADADLPAPVKLATVTEIGTYDYSVEGLEIGVDYKWRLSLVPPVGEETSGSGVFNTFIPASLGLPTFSPVIQSIVRLEVSATPGMGENTLQLYRLVGKVTPLLYVETAVTTSGVYTLESPTGLFGSEITVMARLVNVCGSLTNVVETSPATFWTKPDINVYTWNPLVTDGSVTNPACWICSQEDRQGDWPVARPSKVKFRAGTKARLEMAYGEGGDWYGRWEIDCSEGDCDLHFVGFGKETGQTELRIPEFKGVSSNKRLTIEKMNLYPVANLSLPETFCFTDASCESNVIRLVDARLHWESFTGNIVGKGVRIEMENSSLEYGADIPGAHNLNIGTPGTEIVISNSVFQSAALTPLETLENVSQSLSVPGGDVGPVTFRFQGEAPSFLLDQSSLHMFRPLSEEWVNFVFELPRGGYAQAPIRANVEGEMVRRAFPYKGYVDWGGKEPYASIVIDENSPALKHRSRAFPLIRWSGGIDTARLRVKGPKGMTYEYLPSDSDVKTELWVTPPSSVGLMILVQ